MKNNYFAMFFSPDNYMSSTRKLWSLHIEIDAGRLSIWFRRETIWSWVTPWIHSLILQNQQEANDTKPTPPTPPQKRRRSKSCEVKEESLHNVRLSLVWESYPWCWGHVLLVTTTLWFSFLVPLQEGVGPPPGNKGFTYQRKGKRRKEFPG